MHPSLSFLHMKNLISSKYIPTYIIYITTYPPKERKKHSQCNENGMRYFSRRRGANRKSPIVSWLLLRYVLRTYKYSISALSGLTYCAQQPTLCILTKNMMASHWSLPVPFQPTTSLIIIIIIIN